MQLNKHMKSRRLVRTRKENLQALVAGSFRALPNLSAKSLSPEAVMFLTVALSTPAPKHSVVLPPAGNPFTLLSRIRASGGLSPLQ